GFDELFFAHMEEIDFCWRAKNLNYRVKYVHASKVFHLGGGTLSNLNPRKTYLNFRNSLFTIIKNAKGNLFPIIFVRLVLDGLAAIKFLWALKPDHTFAVLKAHISFYWYLPHYLTLRKIIKNKVKDYDKTSIVIDYFANKNRTFNSL